MSVISKSLLASVAILFSSSLPLYAQSLAEAVIEEYFAEMGQSGMTVTPGTKTVSGNTVEWSDVVFGLPSDGGTYTLPFIRAEEIGGGKVSVTYPEDIELRIDAKGEQPAMDVKMHMSGVQHIISGEAEARAHMWEADTMSINLTSPEPGFAMQIDLTDILSNQVNSGTDVKITVPIRLSPTPTKCMAWRRVAREGDKAGMDVSQREDLSFPRSLPEFQRLFPDGTACAA